MKKFVVGVLASVLLIGSVTPAMAGDTSNVGKGGVGGFFAGCCLGPRAAADYNGGKAIHWLEWTPMLPYVGIVFAIWNGVNGASGMTRADYVEQYGSVYY